MDDAYFMRAALEEARRALLAGEFPVGCVIVQAGRIIVRGARRGSRPPHPSEIDHAEMVALRQLDACHQGIPREDLVIYSTMEPCLMCFAAILLAGIERIVYAYEDVMGGGTQCDRSTMAPLYRDAAPVVIADVCRSESLVLFQRFFSDPDNGYWADSLLSRYTLAQSSGI